VCQGGVWAYWPSKGGGGPRRSGLAWLISKGKSNMDLIFEFQEISEFGKASEICTEI
jgi:hypothetical protein